ncbi:hypothetical protein EFQU50X_01321 [Enterococcus faecium]|nr:hypothetical protein EFQU50X_01321 [Enterococcus faecium]
MVLIKSMNYSGEIVGTSLLYMKIYSMVGAIILRINPFLYKLFAY